MGGIGKRVLILILIVFQTAPVSVRAQPGTQKSEIWIARVQSDEMGTLPEFAYQATAKRLQRSVENRESSDLGPVLKTRILTSSLSFEDLKYQEVRSAIEEILAQAPDKLSSSLRADLARSLSEHIEAANKKGSGSDAFKRSLLWLAQHWALEGNRDESRRALRSALQLGILGMEASPWIDWELGQESKPEAFKTAFLDEEKGIPSCEVKLTRGRSQLNQMLLNMRVDGDSVGDAERFRVSSHHEHSLAWEDRKTGRSYLTPLSCGNSSEKTLDLTDDLQRNAFEVRPWSEVKCILGFIVYAGGIKLLGVGSRRLEKEVKWNQQGDLIQALNTRSIWERVETGIREVLSEPTCRSSTRLASSQSPETIPYDLSLSPVDSTPKSLLEPADLGLKYPEEPSSKWYNNHWIWVVTGAVAASIFGVYLGTRSEESAPSIRPSAARGVSVEFK